MAYLVVVTFDLDNASTSMYPVIEKELNNLGLYDTLVGSNKTPAKLPANTFSGEFNGSMTSKIRDDITSSIVSLFERLGVHSKVFITASSDWAWSTRTT